MESQDKYRVALLSSYALALHGFETLIPSPIPWLRLGLSNIVTLVTLYQYGMKPALMVTLIRVVLGSLFLGTFLGPAFFLSLGGGLAGAFSMGIVITLFPGLFSPLGLSLIGALFHNTAQLFIAYLFFIQRIDAIILVAPVLIAAGTLTGAINGIAARYLVIEIQKADRESPSPMTGT
ncbi:MAG: Gx transporter family protein [Nitrospirae bacterium]|nr:Gx transporter family protein [Nitrospirota bacterium]